MVDEHTLARLRAAAKEFPRKGHVYAERLESPVSWETERGSVLQANSGDWVVSDGNSIWTVVDESFRSSYTPDGDRWARTGSVLAVQAEQEMTIPTLEGPAVALPGDWICWYPALPECWPVSAERFTSLYLAPSVSPKQAAELATAARTLLGQAVAHSRLAHETRGAAADRKVPLAPRTTDRGCHALNP